ncbi:hypothetical protein V8G54_009438 [Vigna mungo]|uniref:Uncharacterized protein n=1 Tax=Vigna mungo TaxID=3915 RepID=A0AAQ3S5G3_VIGMU
MQGVGKRRKCPWERQTQSMIDVYFPTVGEETGATTTCCIAGRIADGTRTPCGVGGSAWPETDQHCIPRPDSVGSWRKPPNRIPPAETDGRDGSRNRPRRRRNTLGNEEKSARTGSGPGTAVGCVDVGKRVKGEHGRGWGVGGGGRAVEGAWVEEGVVVVVVEVVVVRLRVEVVVVVVGEVDGGGGGSGDGGVSWRVEKVVGDERVRGVVVEDLTVGLVGSSGCEFEGNSVYEAASAESG